MARRERNIFKRRDGRYEARYVVSRNENGKAKYRSVYAHTYAEVKEKLDRAKFQILELSTTPDPLQQKVIEALEIYLNSIQHRVKESTHGLYQRYFENYISPHFKNTLCDQLTLEMMQNFVDSLLGSGLAVVTVRSVFSFLKNGVKQTLSQDIFAIKLPKIPANKVEVLSIDEQKRLETAAKASDAINQVAIILCLYTGIRIGELCGLMWEDIDFERCLLQINRTVQRIRNTEKGKKTKVVCLTPKSDTSQSNVVNLKQKQKNS